jgi:hypothetical protein
MLKAADCEKVYSDKMSGLNRNAQRARHTGRLFRYT